MNKILLGSVALAAMLATPALAADYAAPRRAATFAPPAANWTGFYIGGNVGGVWGNTDPGFIAGCPGTAGSNAFFGGVLPNLPDGTCYWNFGGAASSAAFPTVVSAVGTQPYHNHGWEGGGQIGFNYQYQWAVFGVEADFQAFKPKGSRTVTGAYPATIFSAAAINAGPCTAGSLFGGCQFAFSDSTDGKWLATVRGRVGAVWGNWMVYGTFGVAWARMSFTSAFADTVSTLPGPGGFALNAPLVNTVTYNQTKYGPAGGAGLSYLLTPNWILSVEYLRVELYGYGGDNRAVTAGAAPGFAPGTFNANFHYDTTFIENIVRAKLDFKF